MTSVARKFGTDLSNIHNGSKLKKKSPFKPIKEKISNQEWRTVSKQPEITPQTPTTSSLRYSMDFLLSLRASSQGKVQPLIPEVLPGYVDPNRTYIQKQTPKKTNGDASTPKFRPKKQESSDNKENIQTQPTVQEESTTPSKPVDTPVWNVPKPAPVISIVSIVESETVTPVVPKPKERKEKQKETDEKRLASRQKQIDIGMNTVGYRRFLESVPENQRKKPEYRIPDKFQLCSKRSWDGQVRKWRRMLHQFDPEGATNDIDIDLDDLEPVPNNNLAINLDQIFVMRPEVLV
eukprot:TRINITY_DN9884_c0_g1_i2.p1 TRINITY_DN9884_c0_g1~~TRINITY_DN9884_c0_g1_i2.p1  ORF type:complete len:292 (-),score=93.16 TRINITY_DN9884_c0_g1_i2:42-917(-)